MFKINYKLSSRSSFYTEGKVFYTVESKKWWQLTWREHTWGFETHEEAKNYMENLEKENT